jgi:hypothetical protein
MIGADGAAVAAVPPTEGKAPPTAAAPVKEVFDGVTADPEVPADPEDPVNPEEPDDPEENTVVVGACCTIRDWLRGCESTTRSVGLVGRMAMDSAPFESKEATLNW